MTGVPTYFYLALSAVLFTVGTVGVLIRKNPILHSSDKAASSP